MAQSVPTNRGLAWARSPTPAIRGHGAHREHCSGVRSAGAVGTPIRSGPRSECSGRVRDRGRMTSSMGTADIEATLGYFRDLGTLVAQRWSARGLRPDSLPDIAAAALEE